MQRTAILPRGDLLVGPFRLRQSQFRRDRDNAAQFRIESLHPLQVEASEPLRGKLSLFDPTRELRQRSEGNVFILCREWSRIGVAADKSVVRRARLLSGQHRIPERVRCESRF